MTHSSSSSLIVSRHFSPFTREDEKELFEDDLGPNFLSDFRGSYCDSCESCSVEVIIDLSHATVYEIESWELNEALIGVQASFDRHTTTLKLPDNIRKLELAVCDEDETSARDSEKTFLAFLADQIASFQFQKIIRENPNKYKCATCQKTPVTRSVSNSISTTFTPPVFIDRPEPPRFLHVSLATTELRQLDHNSLSRIALLPENIMEGRFQAIVLPLLCPSESPGLVRSSPRANLCYIPKDSAFILFEPSSRRGRLQAHLLWMGCYQQLNNEQSYRQVVDLAMPIWCDHASLRNYNYPRIDSLDLIGRPNPGTTSARERLCPETFQASRKPGRGASLLEESHS
jgi:hypothetical protein